MTTAKDDEVKKPEVDSEAPAEIIQEGETELSETDLETVAGGSGFLKNTTMKSYRTADQSSKPSDKRSISEVYEQIVSEAVQDA